MLTTLAVILIALWALGLLGGYAAAGPIHLLLVVAVALLLIRLLPGRRIV